MDPVTIKFEIRENDEKSMAALIVAGSDEYKEMIERNGLTTVKVAFDCSGPDALACWTEARETFKDHI